MAPAQPGYPVGPRVTLSPAAGPWWTLAAMAVAGVIAAVLQLARNGYGVLDAVHSMAVLRLVVTSAMSGVGVGVLVYGVLWQLLVGRRMWKTCPAPTTHPPQPFGNSILGVRPPPPEHNHRRLRAHQGKPYFTTLPTPVHPQRPNDP